MVSRTSKILVATLVLAGGIGLAWPFRHASGPERSPGEPPPAPEPQRLTGPVILPSPTSTAATMASLPPEEQSSGGAASESSLSSASPPVEKRIVRRPAPPPAPPVVPEEFAAPDATGIESNMRPVYQTRRPEPTDEESTESEWVHVIHNGDTLERLARRYLGDAARALEIFDLNRDVLDNPHLLPIGAEIKIPETAESAAARSED